MSTKQLILETINGLAEDASWQEIEARIRLLAEVNQGREELDRGEGLVVRHEADFLKLARGGR